MGAFVKFEMNSIIIGYLKAFKKNVTNVFITKMFPIYFWNIWLNLR
jgi:hypothetical protein